MEEVARAPRLGAALTTNGGRSEEELSQGGETVRQTVAGRQKRWSVFVTRLLCDGGSYCWIITKF